MCFGRLSVVAANFTSAIDGKITSGFEFSIVKGCAVKSKIEAEQIQSDSSATSDYSSVRKCWTSQLVSKKLTFDDELIPQDMLKALELDGITSGGNSSLYAVDYKMQSEVCVCDGWYCNGTTRIFVNCLFTYVSVIIALLW